MIRNLEYPQDARKVIDSLIKGLHYDASIAVLGNSAKNYPLPENDKPDLSTGIRFGGKSEDIAVRKDAPSLLSQFSLISMVSRMERNAQPLLIQRRFIEEIYKTGKEVDGNRLWEIKINVHKESRGGPVKLCSELVVEKPSKKLLDRMEWLSGVVRIRNCLAHRLGIVEFEDLKKPGKSLDDIKDDDTLKVKWLETKLLINGKEIEKFPHKGGGKTNLKFKEYEREWKIGDKIEINPIECQAIGMSFSMLGNLLLSEFESEMNSVIKEGKSPSKGYRFFIYP
jgi:hypothetical protein